MKKLFPILFISPFIFSCDSEDNPVSVSNEIDVDWVLVKTPKMSPTNWTNENIDDGLGYYFYFTTSSNISNLNLEEHVIIDESGNELGCCEIILNSDIGLLSFTYSGENFSFDLSDSYNSITNNYFITTEIESPQRIIYNQEMGYFTLFGPSGFYGTGLNVLSPNELIDYR